MKKFLFAFLLCLLPMPVFSEVPSPYGAWECVVPGDEGTAYLCIDPVSHFFSFQFPAGEKLNILFKTMIVDGDTTGIVLLTPDQIAHPVNLIKKGENLTVEFYEEKLAPNLECKRPGQGFAGH